MLNKSVYFVCIGVYFLYAWTIVMVMMTTTMTMMMMMMVMVMATAMAMVTMTVMVVVTVSDGDDDDHDDYDDDADGDLIQYCLIHFLEGQPSTPRRGEKVLGLASKCFEICLLVSKCITKDTFWCQNPLSSFFEPGSMWDRWITKFRWLWDQVSSNSFM